MSFFMDPNFPDAFSKGLIGTDSILKKLNNISTTLHKNLGGYPPYNIRKISENKYLLELAVAGFGKQDLEIELKDDVLTIKGLTDTTESKEDSDYIYKGIASRAFTRSFVLADTVEIWNAQLINGMLKIFLDNIVPESKKPKKINIEDTEEPTSEKQFLVE